MKRNLLSQAAASDSELVKYRTKSNSMANVHDPLFFGDGDNDSICSSNKGFLFPMQNVKHNVTEKVAQVCICIIVAAVVQLFQVKSILK